jgi:hypothetical protein
LLQQSWHALGPPQRAETGYRVRIVEIPLAFRDADTAWAARPGTVDTSAATTMRCTLRDMTKTPHCAP